ncbi:LLM class flavin-dependent oxidoreductase [Streptomyces sp. SAS_276]|uniref:LLM class flavin-dependent oxidoreductase n=1 Tax=Streptomyces sp. SAS_276 TaxID=3412745 RepID=UPI00403CD820
MSPELLWYVPNTVEPGHRGDDTTDGWGGALLGTGWGRPDTFTVAAATATLDQLSRGRVLVNIVSGLDNLAAYGDGRGDPAQRYERTQEFLPDGHESAPDALPRQRTPKPLSGCPRRRGTSSSSGANPSPDSPNASTARGS